MALWNKLFSAKEKVPTLYAEDKVYLNIEKCKQYPYVARKALYRMANAGSADAWNVLGDLYYEGIGVAVDKAAAELHYLHAYELGNVEATYSLGYMYLNGDGVPETVSRGTALLKQAAENNHVKACRHLGFLYFWDKKVPKNDALSFVYMLRAADLGDGAAQTHVAQAYEGGMWGAPHKNYELAKRYYAKALEQKNNHALWCMGHKYMLGIDGYQKDEAKGFCYFQEAAKQGSSKALLRLALCYLRGAGTEKNYTLALPWLNKAVEAGNKEAAARYGMVLASGLTVKSIDLFQKGCELILRAAAEDPDDETVQSAAELVTTKERIYGSFVEAVQRGATKELMSYAVAPIYIERTDLELDELNKSIDELNNSQDICNRVVISKANLDAYGSLSSGTWDDCFQNASEAMRAFEELNTPTEKDYKELRDTYAYLAVSAYKMSVEYGVHTFAEAEAFFNKAKPFAPELGERIVPYYMEFLNGTQRPAQERGIIGKIDMLFFRAKYDEAMNLIGSIKDSDVLRLNLDTRSLLGTILLGKTPFAEEILESVVKDDIYTIKAKTLYVVHAALVHHYNNYVKTKTAHAKVDVNKWINHLKAAGGNTFPVVVDMLKKSEQDYSELLQWILNETSV